MEAKVARRRMARRERGVAGATNGQNKRLGYSTMHDADGSVWNRGRAWKRDGWKVEGVLDR